MRYDVSDVTTHTLHGWSSGNVSLISFNFVHARRAPCGASEQCLVSLHGAQDGAWRSARLSSLFFCFLLCDGSPVLVHASWVVSWTAVIFEVGGEGGLFTSHVLFTLCLVCLVGVKEDWFAFFPDGPDRLRPGGFSGCWGRVLEFLSIQLISILPCRNDVILRYMEECLDSSFGRDQNRTDSQKILLHFARFKANNPLFSFQSKGEDLLVRLSTTKYQRNGDRRLSVSSSW